MKKFLKQKINEAKKQVEEACDKFNNDKNITFYRGVRDAYLYLYRNSTSLTAETLMQLYTSCKEKQSDYYDGACVAYKVVLERLFKI